MNGLQQVLPKDTRCSEPSLTGESTRHCLAGVEYPGCVCRSARTQWQDDWGGAGQQGH